MDTNLIWNFKIKGQHNLAISIPTFEPHDLKWEARFFWNDQQDILLNNLDIDISKSRLKTTRDIYYLLPNKSYNLKCRHGIIYYKPLLHDKAGIKAYGRKTPLSSDDPLQQEIRQQGKEVHINKQRVSYQFATSPKLKIEFAKLTISDRHYFSLCIESRSFTLVQTLKEQLLNEQNSCDYITFLTQQITT